jgi:hypothetical protein
MDREAIRSSSYLKNDRGDRGVDFFFVLQREKK